jgi:DNA-binding NarL/FixJ family response regulator
MAGRYGTVLVADRHHQMLKGVHTLLSELFSTVVMVADERSLLEAARKLAPDLAIVDLSLGRNSRDGDDADGHVAETLVAAHPRLRVIVLSVHDEPAAVRQTLAAGAAAFVLKRSAGSDLVPAVREVLRGGRYVSPGAVGSARDMLVAVASGKSTKCGADSHHP